MDYTCTQNNRKADGSRSLSPAPLCADLKQFRRQEDGSIFIFACFMMVFIFAMIGLSIDFMRAERNRTVLQHTLDRALLAAADLDQERDPETVVSDYFEAAGLGDTLSDVNADIGINYKTLSATASVQTTAPYMGILERWAKARETNIDVSRKLGDNENFRQWKGARDNPEHTKSVTSTATAAAEERVSNVEISMVLDVSGSMGSNSRMSNLKVAAKDFIDTVLKEETDGLVSVSMIPYDEHVSLGSQFYNTLRNRLSVTHRHNYSHCIEFPDGEFSQTGLNLNSTYEQMQHTRLYGSWGFQCSTAYQDRVTPLSQDAYALKAQVEQLQPSGNTHTFMGMKWAAALLNPSFQPVTNDLVNANLVDSDFADRPAAFEDNETLKTIILMTDGVNTSSYRVKSPYYATSSHYYHWSRWGIKDYLNRYVSSYYHSRYYYTKYNGSLGDSLLNSICSAAKQDGIVIWSIGFEVNDHGANVMQQCASSPSHFFRVEGIEISDAFDAIARQINQLRLIQ